MASLLTTGDIAGLTGSFGQHFDTFSPFRTLTIHKEPLKTISSNEANIYAGYRETSNESNFTFTPVSGAYPAIVVWDVAKGQELTQLNTINPVTTVTIKVKRDARDFIRNGKNELFEIDGLSFNELTEGKVQNFLGLTYYYFTLRRTT